MNEQKRENWIDQSDTIVMEDEYGRLQLSQVENGIIDKIVSGVVCAAIGYEDEKGKFAVQSIHFPKIGPQKPIQKMSQPRYLLLASGMQIGSPEQNIGPELLAEFASGYAGNESVADLVSSIVATIIVGSSLYRFDKRKLRNFSREETDPIEILGPLRQLDALFTQIARSCPLFVMPGSSDPCNVSLPQQPFHPCMFPSSSTYNNFHLLPNPSKLVVDGVELLGSSGQPISNLRMSCSAQYDIEYLERCFFWRHLAPTAPDTLSCFPFKDIDPFVISNKSCPHVLFSGNAEKFDSRLVEGPKGQRTRLIMVPVFATTGTAVLLDLSTPELNAMPVTLAMGLQ